MRLRLVVGVAAWLLSAGLPAQRARLQECVREAAALGVDVGLVALDRQTGRVLARDKAREVFVPASNQKLLTAIAALEVLGADYRFRTTFRVRQGILEVLAAGDPNWRTGGEHDPARIFAAVGAWLRSRELFELRGVSLVAGPFTGPRRPRGWPADQLVYRYCAPTGGLVLDEGCFRARIAPGAGGTAAIEVIAPPVAMPVDGALRMTSDRARGGRYHLSDAGGRLRARGHFYRKATPRVVVGAVQDPEALFRQSLVRALTDAGVTIDADAPPRDEDLATYDTPLRAALRPMLVDSSNFHAEQVLRVLGAEHCGDGSFEGGTRALRSAIGALVGATPDTWRVADGSGLSRDNRVTPALLAGALQRALRRDFADVLVAALPRAARDGTLRQRFVGSAVAPEVRAKTGWIRGASTITGITGRCVFSIMMRYDRKRSGLNKQLKALQERIVEAMAALPRS